MSSNFISVLRLAPNFSCRADQSTYDTVLSECNSVHDEPGSQTVEKEVNITTTKTKKEVMLFLTLTPPGCGLEESTPPDFIFFLMRQFGMGNRWSRNLMSPGNHILTSMFDQVWIFGGFNDSS